MERYFRIETYDERDIYFMVDIDNDKLSESEKYKLALESSELSIDDIDNVYSVEEVTHDEYNANKIISEAVSKFKSEAVSKVINE